MRRAEYLAGLGIGFVLSSLAALLLDPATLAAACGSAAGVFIAAAVYAARRSVRPSSPVGAGR